MRKGVCQVGKAIAGNENRQVARPKTGSRLAALSGIGCQVFVIIGKRGGCELDRLGGAMAQ